FALRLDAAAFSFGFGLDDGLGFFGLGGSFHGGAAFGFDPFGLRQRGFGHGAVLGFLDSGFGFALLGFAYAESFGLLDLQIGLRRGDFGLRVVFAGDGLGVGIRQRDAHLLFRVLDLRVALETG